MTDTEMPLLTDTLEEGAKVYSNLALGDAVSHVRAMNALREAFIGNMLKRATEMSVEESMKMLKELSTSGFTDQLQSILTTVNSLKKTS